MAGLLVDIERVIDADIPEQAKVDARAVVKAVKSVEAPDAFVAYLVDGVVPQDQNVPGMPLPVPTQ